MDVLSRQLSMTHPLYCETRSRFMSSQTKFIFTKGYWHVLWLLGGNMSSQSPSSTSGSCYTDVHRGYWDDVACSSGIHRVNASKIIDNGLFEIVSYLRDLLDCHQIIKTCKEWVILETETLYCLLLRCEQQFLQLSTDARHTLQRSSARKNSFPPPYDNHSISVPSFLHSLSVLFCFAFFLPSVFKSFFLFNFL